MTISLEPDLESKLKRFPQILERLPHLLAEQIALEEWRERRYSAEARAIVNDVLAPKSGEAEVGAPDFARLERAFAVMAPYLEAGDESGS